MGRIVEASRCRVGTTTTARDLERIPAAGLRIPVVELLNATPGAAQLDLGLSAAPSTPGGVPSDAFRVDGRTELPSEHSVTFEVFLVAAGSQLEVEVGHELGAAAVGSPEDLGDGAPDRVLDRFLTVRNVGDEPVDLALVGLLGPRSLTPSDRGFDLRLDPGSSFDGFVDFSMLAPSPQPRRVPSDGDEWADLPPRLGLTYHLGAERKTLLRASYSGFGELPSTPRPAYRSPFEPAEPVVVEPRWLQPIGAETGFGSTITFRQGATTDWSLGSVDPIGPRSRGSWVGFAEPGAHSMRPREQPYSHGLFVHDDWRLNERWSFNLGVRYDEPDPVVDDPASGSEASRGQWWSLPGREHSIQMETEQVPSYTGVITQNLFTEPTAPRRFSFLSHLPVAEKVGGAVVFVGALAFAFGGTCLGDWTETRMVRIGGGAAASAESVVPAQITQFTGGGDHPAFRETYRDAATGLALSGLSVGMGCAATSGVPSGAIVVLDLSGPLGSTTWNGQLDAQARVRVVGGINAPGSYTVTGGSWFLPATPAQRNRLSLGPAGTFSVPSPPAENPCDPSTLAPGVPLAASSASGAEAEPRTRTVTERHDAFPWSIPTGLGLAGLVAGGLWYDDRRRREDEREASGDAYDPARAAQLLDEAGWTADPETGARRPSGP